MADEDDGPRQAGITAGRWDRDPPRPNPGPGPWMDPGPVDRPEPAEPAADDPVARLQRANGGPARDPGNWHTDVTRPTVRRIDLTRGVR